MWFLEHFVFLLFKTVKMYLPEDIIKDEDVLKFQEQLKLKAGKTVHHSEYFCECTSS